MKKQDKGNSLILRASAYGVALLLMMMVGCDNLSNTDQSEIGQDESPLPPSISRHHLTITAVIQPPVPLPIQAREMKL